MLAAVTLTSLLLLAQVEPSPPTAAEPDRVERYSSFSAGSGGPIFLGGQAVLGGLHALVLASSGGSAGAALGIGALASSSLGAALFQYYVPIGRWAAAIATWGGLSGSLIGLAAFGQAGAPGVFLGAFLASQLASYGFAFGLRGDDVSAATGALAFGGSAHLFLIAYTCMWLFTGSDNIWKPGPGGNRVLLPEGLIVAAPLAGLTLGLMIATAVQPPASRALLIALVPPLFAGLVALIAGPLTAPAWRTLAGITLGAYAVALPATVLATAGLGEGASPPQVAVGPGAIAVRF